MENLVKKIRTALQMSQTEFAAAIGMSYGSVQSYERGANIPAPVLDRIHKLSQDNHLPDREVIISTGKLKVERPSIDPTSARLHALLDDIINSGDEEAINAVTSNLILFSRYIRSLKFGEKRRVK